MAERLFELNLKDIWGKASEETAVTRMIPPWFLEQLVTRLGILQTNMQAKLPPSKLKMVLCEELRSIIEEIKFIKTDEGIPKDDFDLIWDILYDWADSRVGEGYLCWIKTKV